MDRTRYFPAPHKKRSRSVSSSQLKVAVEVSASLDSRVIVTAQPSMATDSPAWWLEEYQLCCHNLMELASLIQVSKLERECVFHLGIGLAS